MKRYDMDAEIEHKPELNRVIATAYEVQSEIGRWVRFEDAAKLQDRIDALESELEEIKQKGV